MSCYELIANAPVAYISFDTVPAAKGAAIHIAAFTRSLAAEFGGVDLVTVAPGKEAIAPRELWQGVWQTQLPALGETLIHRVLYFRTMLGQWWQEKHYPIVHFRSIFEGFPIALRKEKLCDRLIFEINGLPSIELKYRYPNVASDRDLLYKLEQQEKVCLDAADRIITPSNVTQTYLVNRGVNSDKIHVIPNGVDLKLFTYQPPETQPKTEFRLLYFGTLSAWQGVRQAIEALALVNRDLPATLTLVGQGRSQPIRELQKQAQDWHVGDRLQILEPVSQLELVQHIHQADAVLVPLTPSDRNLVQGCCPLKLLETMATGTPAIASDLPVVRDLGNPGEHFLVAKPGSAKSIKDAVLQLQASPDLATHLARNARQHIEQQFTWEIAGQALVDVYRKLQCS